MRKIYKQSINVIIAASLISCTSSNKNSTEVVNSVTGERTVAAAVGAEDVSLVPSVYKNPQTKMTFWEEMTALQNDKKSFDSILAPRLGKSLIKKLYAKNNKEFVNFMIWVRANPVATFKDLRTHAPVLKLSAVPNKDEARNYKYGDTYVISKYKDVVDVLSKPTVFTVKNYTKKMESSVGPYMLAYDGTAYNAIEKPWMRELLMKEDLEAIRKTVRAVTQEMIQEQSFVGKDYAQNEFARLEVVNQIARRVPAILTKNYFGFKAVNDNKYSNDIMIEKILEWSRATQDEYFHNVVNDPAIRDRSDKAGKEMHAHLKYLFEKAKKQIQEDIASKGIDVNNKNSSSYKAYYKDLSVLERMLLHEIKVVTKNKSEEEENFRLRANVIGTLVGGIETTQAAIAQSIYQIMIRPKIFNEVKMAAAKNDYDTVAKYVWEALRFHPVNPFVVRYVAQDYTVNGVKIPAGSHVFVGTQSAMFDEEIVGNNSELFDINNPQKQKVANMFHLGFGHHRCLGDYVSEVQVPEIVMAVFQLPNVKRAEGQAGLIDFRIRLPIDDEKIKDFMDHEKAIFTEYSTSFPEKFAIDFSSSAIKNKNRVQIADRKYPYEAYLNNYDRDLYRQCLSALHFGTTVADVNEHKMKFTGVIANAIRTQIYNADSKNRELMYCRMSYEFQKCMASEMDSKKFAFNSKKDEEVIKHREAYFACSKKANVHPDEDQFYQNVFFQKPIDYSQITGQLKDRPNNPKYEFEDYLVFHDRYKTKHSMLNPLGLKNMPESEKILMYTRLNIDFRMCFGQKAILAKKKEKMSREDAYVFCRDGVYEPTQFRWLGELTNTEKFFYEKMILGRDVKSFQDLLPRKQ